MKKEKILSESNIAKKRRAGKILKILCEEFPEVTTDLDHTSAFELLIATILSAQCTDVRVNIVTKDLFEKYKTPGDYVKADTEDLEEDIHSTGFYKMKTKSLKACCRDLMEKYNGKVPDTMEELIQLHGVARKTANVILGMIFKKAEGIVIDTHVDRISRKLGLSNQKNRDKMEKELMELIPKTEWIDFGSRIIFHGRKTCKARKPVCGECRLFDLCPSREDNL